MIATVQTENKMIYKKIIWMMLMLVLVTTMINARPYTYSYNEEIIVTTEYIDELNITRRNFTIDNDINGSLRIHFYSDKINKNLTIVVEGTRRYLACKNNITGLLYVEKVLGFNCSTYNNYESYIQYKINETELYKYNQTQFTDKYEPNNIFRWIQRKVKGLINQINTLQNKIEWIENNGYTGNCTQTIIQKGIITGCND